MVDTKADKITLSLWYNDCQGFYGDNNGFAYLCAAWVHQILHKYPDNILATVSRTPISPASVPFVVQLEGDLPWHEGDSFVLDEWGDEYDLYDGAKDILKEMFDHDDTVYLTLEECHD
jgi:hypothetical protein